MPIQIETETIVTLAEAAKILPPLNGRRPSICTMWRWCRKGVRGVQLEYVRVGRNIATSREALGRFVNRLAAADQATETAQAPHPATAVLHAKPRHILPNRKPHLNGLTADEVLDRAGI